MFSQKLTGSIAVGAAAIAVAIGAYTIDNSSSSSGSSGAANAATLAQPGRGPRAFGQGRPNWHPGMGTGQNQTVVGQVPQGWHSGSGTIITGTTADKAMAVALAKYPGGTVNRVLQLSDGTYAVHMIKISWPHHVFVSTTFQVTGAIG